MKKFRRNSSLFFVLGLVALLSVSMVVADQPQSPREAFDQFLSAMVDVKQGQSERMSDAIDTLYLEDVAPLIRDDAARKFADDLKNFLDKHERVEIQSIPESSPNTRWIYYQTDAGQISVIKTDSGAWLFSSETRQSLPALLDSVRGKKYVAGIEGGGGTSKTIADWVRSQVSAPLAKRSFLLENWQWLALLLLIFVGVIIDRLVRWLLHVWIHRLFKSSKLLRDNKAEANFEKPVGILFMGVVWYLLLPILDLPLQALLALKFAAQFVAAVAGVWAAYRLVDLVAEHFIAIASTTETKIDDILVPLVRRALKIMVVAFGILFVASNLNINVTSMLAGLGIGGVALALAAKDTVENLFGSLTVLIDRPFQIGDWIVMGDLEGTVEEIGFRSTRVRTFYDSLITFPNAKLVSAAVDNLGVRRYRRLKAMIGIEYNTPAHKIDAFCEGIRELIRKHPYTRKDYYNVYFNEFSDSSLNILLYTFFETPDWPTELRERHRLLADVVRLAGRLGIGFAFPTRTLHVASVPPGLAIDTKSGLENENALASESKPPSKIGPLDPAPYQDAIKIGRNEAQEILDKLWGDEPQAPVDFADPDRVKPGK